MIDGFEQIKGQPLALSLLDQAVKTGQIAHAYLFAGPAGVGKSTTAGLFAREMIRVGDPSGLGLFDEGIHPDFMMLGVPEGKSRLGIELINKDLRDWLAYKPYRCASKLVIIEQSHLMTLEAANALLKTLEEPPGYAVMILLADEEIGLPTIRSRCQLVKFRPLGEEELCELLLAEGIPASQARQAAIIAQGSTALARSLATIDLAELRQEAVDWLHSLASGRKSAVMDLAQALEQEESILLSLLKLYLRDIIVYQQTGQAGLLCFPENESLAGEIRLTRPEAFGRFWDNSSRLGRYYGGSINASLVSANLAFEFARLFA